MGSEAAAREHEEAEVKSETVESKVHEMSHAVLVFLITDSSLWFSELFSKSFDLDDVFSSFLRCVVRCYG